MSILIKGMKMPKNCSMCQFHGFGGYKNELIVCSLKGRSEGQLSNMPNCPLVEVPTPHGRLIDADAAIDDIHGEILECQMNGMKGTPPYTEDLRTMWQRLEDEELIPTIIEAEEGEE